MSYVPNLAFSVNQPNVPLNAAYRSLGETIFAAFNANVAGNAPIIFRTRPELHLFARDPREVYFTLAFEPELSKWPAQMSTPSVEGVHTPPYAVPADMVIPYGTNSVSDLYPNWADVNVVWPNFWRMEQTGTVLTQSQWLTSGYVCGNQYDCLASSPDGYGSIKAVRSVELPECSGSLRIQSVFGDLQNQVSSALTCKEQQRFGPVPCGYGTYNISPSLVALNAMSYLNHVDPGILAQQPLDTLALDKASTLLADEGVVGGVLVGGQLHVVGETDNTCGFDWEPCDVTFLYDLQFSLDANGYVAIIPHRITLSATNGTLCNGGGSFVTGAKDLIQSLFETQLPGYVHQIAKDKQKIPAPDTTVPPSCNADGQACSIGYDCCSRACTSGVCVQSKTLPWSCSYEIAEPPFAQYDILSECADAWQELELAVAEGGAKLGVDSQKTARLNDIIYDAANWRCRRPNPAELAAECIQGKRVRGKCEFKVPAKMVIAEPDEVRVGFSALDNFVQATCVPNGTNCAITNPSDPHEFQSTIAFLTLYQTGGLDSVQRNLCTPPVEAGAGNFYNRYFATMSLGPLSCTPPPKPSNPKRLLCGCSTDSDCATGDTCGSNGLCQNACNSDIDCPSHHCYTDIHLCSGGFTWPIQCASDVGCVPWETCKNICLERPQPDGYAD